MAEFADEAEPGEKFQAVEGHVNFPPVESLAGTGHEVVVVVVPAFAESDQSEEPAVFAGVRGGETAPAEEVRERVDGEGAMPEKDGAQEEAPDQKRQAPDQKHRDAQN